MAYAAYTTINEILPGVTITTGYTAAAQNAMTMASSLIDHHLSKRYSVPFTDVPPLVVDLCKQLGAFFFGRAIFTQDSQNTNNWIEDHYVKAIETLKEIQDYKKDLLNTAGSALSDIGSSYSLKSNTKDYHTIFELDSDTSWKIDPDRTDDISDERG